MKKTLSFFIVLFALIVNFSCSEQSEDKQDAAKKYPQLVGTWQLSDIIFLTPPSSEETKKLMDAGRANILQQVVQMTFKGDFSVTENVNGKIQSGTWNVQNDSILSVQFAGQVDVNQMILRKHDKTQLQFVIGTPDDRSLYVFKIVE